MSLNDQNNKVVIMESSFLIISYSLISTLLFKICQFF